MPRSVEAVRQRPTRRQLEVLRASIAAGSIAGAAHQLGITETTARQHLSGLVSADGMLERGSGRVLAREDGAGAPAEGTRREAEASVRL